MYIIILMYCASKWIFLDLWRFINVLLIIIINLFSRELAFQSAEQFQVLGKPIGLKVVVITGGRGR